MEKHSISTMRNQVYQIIKQEICGGGFKPGQWLQENELAEKLSVSRSPVREALRQLAADGLVVEVPNKGVFVKEFTARDIEETFDLRVLLESYAMHRIPGILTTAGMEQLLGCLDELKRTHRRSDLRQYIEHDTELHNLIIRLAGNSLVESVYGRVYAMIQQFRIYSLVSQERFEESLAEHCDMVHCLLTGDADEAERINRRHLQLARNNIVNHLFAPKEREEGKEANEK